eukprot:Seg1540.8_Seg1540.3 transcript_id=Seg1540.8_Seg1540.3/GoldUCD/mRNA.D3Y31 product="E3 ubiquitin-protein ligase parkin" protein_id=Seg1540.8_Seg1540.3/GoldUCD/D3Y31
MARCPEDAETNQIHVRMQGKNKTVDVGKGWNVLELKKHLGQTTGIKHQQLKIIFAGSALPDNLTLEDCDLGKMSVVHVLVSVEEEEKPGYGSKAASVAVLQPTAAGMQTIVGKRKTARFYVYCKSQCNKAQPGKLRVRCGSCKDEAFTISRDPEGWQDVLERNKVEGSCNECSQKKAEFFFKCTGHEPFGDSRDEAIPLCQVTSNTIDTPCLACLEIQDPILIFPCDDRHALCLPCFSMYCHSKIRDRQLILVEQPKNIGYTLCCPGGTDGCNAAFIEEIHHFRVAGNDLYEQYQRFATEDLVLQSGGILCPGKGCGSGILSEPGFRRIVCDKQTGGCGLIFCRDCLEEFHSGNCRQQRSEPVQAQTDYSAIVANARIARREREMSMKTIHSTTKRCPGCKAHTEKAGGCNHMTCQRCRYQWCWNCEIEWNSNCQGDHWFRLLFP